MAKLTILQIYGLTHNPSLHRRSYLERKQKGTTSSSITITLTKHFFKTLVIRFTFWYQVLSVSKHQLGVIERVVYGVSNLALLIDLYQSTHHNTNHIILISYFESLDRMQRTKMNARPLQPLNGRDITLFGPRWSLRKWQPQFFFSLN